MFKLGTLVKLTKFGEQYSREHPGRSMPFFGIITNILDYDPAVKRYVVTGLTSIYDSDTVDDSYMCDHYEIVGEADRTQVTLFTVLGHHWVEVNGVLKEV